MDAETSIELVFTGETGAAAARRIAAAMIRVYFRNGNEFLPFDDMEKEDADGWIHYPPRNVRAEKAGAFRALLAAYEWQDRSGSPGEPDDPAGELVRHIIAGGNRLVISNCGAVRHTRLIEHNYFEDFFAVHCLILAVKMPAAAFEGMRRITDPSSHWKRVLTHAVYNGSAVVFEQLEGDPVYADHIISWTRSDDLLIKEVRSFPYVMVDIVTDDHDRVKQDGEIGKWIRNINHVRMEMVSASLDFRYASNPAVTIRAASEALCIRTRDDLLALLAGLGYKASCFSRLRAKDFHGAHIVIPAYVTYIGEEAFRDRSSLQGIDIPGSVTDIGAEAFQGCTSLTEIVIPGSVLHIEGFAFSRCRSLKKVILPANLKTVREGLFNGCSALESIVLPGGARKIGQAAFFGCTGLKSIVIPETVWKFGAEIFGECGPQLTIRGKEGSEAERYAAENGIAFEAIE